MHNIGQWYILWNHTSILASNCLKCIRQNEAGTICCRLTGIFSVSIRHGCMVEPTYFFQRHCNTREIYYVQYLTDLLLFRQAEKKYIDSGEWKDMCIMSVTISSSIRDKNVDNFISNTVVNWQCSLLRFVKC